MFGNNQEHSIWVEKYRPDSLDNYIGNPQFLEKLKVYIETQDIPHILLYGTAGQGKCLDFSEEINIEIELTEEEYKKLKQYEI